MRDPSETFGPSEASPACSEAIPIFYWLCGRKIAFFRGFRDFDPKMRPRIFCARCWSPETYPGYFANLPQKWISRRGFMYEDF